MKNGSTYPYISALLILCGVILSGIPGVLGDETIMPQQGLITFQFEDIGDNTINRVSLMKTGEYTKDGRAHQTQNITFNRDTNRIIWNPCNDNDCSYASFPTSGGNNGRDELILEVMLSDSEIDLSSCYGDPTCERLKGGTSTKSGMIDGVFKTGKMYRVYLSSLKPGIGQTFTVTESI